MLTFVKQIFVWWNRDTIGTKLYTIFFGRLVGKDDFGNKIQLLKFVNKYSGVKIMENATIEYLNYDWNLNEKLLK